MVKILSSFGLWIKVFSESRVIISIIITILLFGIAISSEDNVKEHKEKVISDTTKDIQKLIEEGKMLRPCNLCLRENNEHSELKLKLTVI